LLLKKASDAEETAIVQKFDEIGLKKKLSFINDKEKNPGISSVAVNENNNATKKVAPVSGSESPKIVAVSQNKNQQKIDDKAIKNEEKPLLAANEKNKESDKQKIQLPINKKKNKVIESGNSISNKNIADSVKKNGNKEVALNEKNNKKSSAAIDKTNEKSQEKISAEQKVTLKPIVEPEQIASADKQKIEKNIAIPKAQVNLPENKKLPIKIEPLAKVEIPETPPAAQIATRKIETIRTVDISNDSLVLSLFDNGVVDGDTVTVLVNGKVVWPKVALREQSVNKTIYLTREMGDSISVVMYAENLGTIAPNTGLLVVREGGKDHEIRFSGDLKKNSAIILKRKRQEEQ
jgi:hypothetical protein